MSTCINKNSAEFRTLVKQSGLPDFYVSAVCGNFMEKYGRFPYLDEIPGSNSQEYLEAQLELKNGYSKVSKILEMTGQNDIQHSQVSLNNTLRDIEVSIFPLNQEAKVYITKRPVTKELLEESKLHSQMNSIIAIEGIVSKLSNLYGVDVQSITLDEIQNSDMRDVPGLSNKKTFVYNGHLYVNSDLFDKTAPITEMTQLLISPIRGTELYGQLLDIIHTNQDSKAFQEENYGGNESDMLENYLASEITNYITTQSSQLFKLPKNVKYDLFYNIKRTLDTILMGESSIKDFQDSELFNSSLSELCRRVNSGLDVNNYSGTITENNGELDNMYSDIKQEQINNGELKIYCNV